MTLTATTIILAAGTMLVLAVAMAWVLGWANRAFHVEVDERVEKIAAALPGANCGGCGFVGCMDYAEAVVERQGEVPVTLCPVGGSAVAEEIANILGVEVEASWPYRPVVHCAATSADRLKQHEYRGQQSCQAANMVAGVQGCTYGCLGMGDCERACNFDAIHIVDGLAVVDYEKCTGCGACERACPRHIITMVPWKANRMLVVACSSQDSGKEVRDVCTVGCIGCKACTKLSDIFSVEDNVASVDYDKYDPESDFQPLLDKCPREAMIWVGEPSADDQAAVADEDLPDVVKANPHTTVDDAEYRG